ncbi:MAG TPA: helix-turn-helix domain-containing protein [Woeseiaceae bacterium]
MQRTAPSIAGFGERQRRLLSLLLEEKQGRSAEELARALGISRSAVHQHLGALEGGGFVEKTSKAPQGGRPGYAWRLTRRGVHLFPKQYALFSGLLIDGIREQLGSDGLAAAMRTLGRKLGEQQRPRVQGKAPARQVEKVAAIMGELGYSSRTEREDGRELPLIDARNCIYHDLAREHLEVCQLDLALIETLLEADVEHVECMARGGNACRFRIHPRDDRDDDRDDD